MANDSSRPGNFMGDGSSHSNNRTEGSSARQSVKGGSDTDLLRDIDNTLQDILESMDGMSQSAARGKMPGNKKDASRWRPDRRRGGFRGRSSNGMLDKFTDGIEKSLLDSIGASDFKKQIQGSMSKLAESLGTTVDDLPNMLGRELGKQIANSGPGKAISEKIKNFSNSAMDNMSKAFESGQGAGSYKDAIKNGWKQSTSNMFNRNDRDSSQSSGADAQNIRDAASQSQNASDLAQRANRANGDNIIQFPGNPANEAASNVGSDLAGQVGADAATQAGTNAATQAGTSALAEGAGAAAGTAEAGAAVAGTAEAGAAAASAGSALTGLASSAAALGPYLLIAVAALAVLDKAFETLAPAIEGTKEMFKSMSKAANRYNESRKKNLELEKKRISADVEAMITEPFNILKAAAQNLYDTWDNKLKTIAGTQGYNKADVQDLMSAYAQRLRDEGLTKVVSGSDIMTNLSTVLESGLSGKVAEEFAYLATKLSAAVPSQDFFSYASTYASVAANAIKAGKSQADAIAYANSEMENFASNVLYANRQLAGGFSTGLKDAQTLFDYAVQIANASKQGDPALISGVLTSVSAITGAIAPDLAGGIVEAVVKAATGGNSSEIVALRSMAGINASNTEFLKALAANPQEIFSTLFSNLAKMQNMSNDNFMEVAEGLSSVFGISMDAFARVDFNYLANAISQMNVNNSSLDENMSLLVSGQTTTTAEQMKMAQINQYMLEEGLAYVLDNQVARSIQEHMWDEQIARELQEATYAVELQGAALGFLEGLKQTVDNIKNFLNPFSFLKKLSQLAGTAAEAAALKADTRQLLELGKVGRGDPKSLYSLTTTNKDLKLVAPITEMMGGYSAYKAASANRQANFNAFDQLANVWQGGVAGALLGNLVSGSYEAKSFINNALSKNSPSSKYSWMNMSKTSSAALAAAPANTAGLASTSKSDASSTADLAKQKSNALFEKFLDTMGAAVNDNKTYDEWAATAKNYGIKDFSAALESYGKSENELKGAFGNKEAEHASEYKHNREVVEDEFWKQATMFSINEQPKWVEFEDIVKANQDTMIKQMEDINKELDTINSSKGHMAIQFASYIKSWTDYFVKHTAYSDATLDSYKAADIIKAEKKENGDAVLALADALTRNTIGIQEGFKDPVVQTNVLLAKILIVAEAIMQQNNKTGGLSLPDALSALGLGMTTDTV